MRISDCSLVTRNNAYRKFVELHAHLFTGKSIFVKYARKIPCFSNHFLVNKYLFRRENIALRSVHMHDEKKQANVDQQYISSLKIMSVVSQSHRWDWGKASPIWVIQWFCWIIFLPKEIAKVNATKNIQCKAKIIYTYTWNNKLHDIFLRIFTIPKLNNSILVVWAQHNMAEREKNLNNIKYNILTRAALFRSQLILHCFAFMFLSWLLCS